MATPFDYTKTEMVVGAFVLLGVVLLGYLSVSIGGWTLLPQSTYRLSARFSNVGDLKPGAPVKLAGVTVGEVEALRLVDYFGEVELSVEQSVVLPRDTIASISTAGLLGDAYITLSPGASDQDLASGDRITQTEPAINLADLLGRYAFGTGGGGEAPAPPPAEDPAASPTELPPPLPEAAPAPAPRRPRPEEESP